MPFEGGDARGRGRAGERQRRASRGREQRELDQHAPAPAPIGAERREQRRGRGAAEPRADDQPDAGGVEAETCEVQAEEHARHPGGERAGEGGGVDAPPVGDPGSRRRQVIHGRGASSSAVAAHNRSRRRSALLGDPRHPP
jgi:hypothetical protein